MKFKIFALLMVSGLALSSCRKSEVVPDDTQNSDIQKPSTSVPLITQGKDATATDTSANDVTGYIRVQLAKDSIQNDNVLIKFKPTASASYVPGEDAPTFQGFGLVSLSSLSSDRVPLAINALPLTKKGLCISLKFNTHTDDVYMLKLQAIKSVPDNYEIWVKDAYVKDSLNVRLYNTYSFNVYHSDTASTSANRFKLVIRSK